MQTVILKIAALSKELTKLNLEIRRKGLDKEYAEYCEGLIHGAQACLSIITDR